MADDFRILEPVLMHGEACKYCNRIARFHDPDAFEAWEVEHRKSCPAVVRP